MIEFLSEYCLNTIDVTCFLAMYHLLESEKINKKKFILGVIVYALLQYFIERIELSRFLLTIRDSAFIIISLLLYLKKFKIQDIMNAFAVNATFSVSISLFMTFAKIIHIDIARTLSFGLYRFCFSIILKIFVILFMWLFIRQLKKLQVYMTQKGYYIFLGCFSLCILLGATIMQLSVEDDNYANVMFALVFIALISIYISMDYITAIHRKYNSDKLNEILDVEEEQINEIIKQQNKTLKLIHDTKNLFIDIENSIDQNQLLEAKSFIKNWYLTYNSSYVVPICRNSYIDVILRKKIEYYQNIRFNLKIQAPENIPMKNRDLLSILMLLLNYFCENVKDQLDINIRGNNNELSICMKGQIKNDNYLSVNSLEYQNMILIVEKYNGNINIIHQIDLECRIILFF